MYLPPFLIPSNLIWKKKIFFKRFCRKIMKKEYADCRYTAVIQRYSGVKMDNYIGKLDIAMYGKDI